jgi:hypothetical protein
MSPIDAPWKWEGHDNQPNRVNVSSLKESLQPLEGTSFRSKGLRVGNNFTLKLSDDRDDDSEFVLKK